MSDEKKIILPGDPEWNKPLADVVSLPEVPTIPSEVLEAAFTEAVDEAKKAIEAGSPEVPLPVVPEKPKPEPPKITYKYHNPARQRSIKLPGPGTPIEAILLHNLPRRWERICHKKLREGDKVHLIDATFYPGIGMLYGFVEGTRGGFGLRPDDVKIIPPPTPVVANANVDGHDPQVQQERPTDNGQSEGEAVRSE